MRRGAFADACNSRSSGISSKLSRKSEDEGSSSKSGSFADKKAIQYQTYNDECFGLDNSHRESLERRGGRFNFSPAMSAAPAPPDAAQLQAKLQQALGRVLNHGYGASLICSDHHRHLQKIQRDSS